MRVYHDAVEALKDDELREFYKLEERVIRRSTRRADNRDRFKSMQERHRKELVKHKHLPRRPERFRY